MKDRERLYGQFHASLVAADDKIYFTSMEGAVSVVKAGKEFELLPRNEIGETMMGSPAVSRGQFFLRGD
ncbi:MAG TPA: hypothetical protein VKE94_07425 [Gemmataceae bacterium]|nr:hypothetical protein [Gemmataceae bacterium]